MRKGFWWLMLATLLWSGNYVAGRFLSNQIPPLTLNAVRWVISSIILLVMVRLSGRRVPWSQWHHLLILGFLGMFAFSSLTYIGLKTVSAAQAGIISGTMPVLIMVSSVIILRDRPQRLAWLGVGLSVIGVSFIVGNRGQTHTPLSGGDLELIGAAMAWSLYTVLAKKWGQSMDALTLTAGAALIGALFSVTASIWTWHPHAIHLTSTGILAVTYISTAASVIAYVAWTVGVSRVGAALSGPFMNLLPVWTLLLGMSLLHESISVAELIGGTLTVSGAILAGRPTKGR